MTNYANQSDITSGNSPTTALLLLLEQFTNDMQTAALVKVNACTSSGALAVAGTVNVQPLVMLVDGAMQTYPHGVVNNLLYLRMQGGANAIILDPVVGDLGLAVFCNRDTTHVRATKAPAAPGSLRKFSWSDGIYLGGVLNGAPSNYVQFQGGTITLGIGGAAVLAASSAGVNITGTLTVSGDATINGRDFMTHEHSGVQGGSSNTGGVV